MTKKKTSAPPDGERLVRRREVLARTGLSETSLYRLIRRGDFPKPRQLSTVAVAWRLSEVQGWINSRPEASGLGLGPGQLARTRR